MVRNPSVPGLVVALTSITLLARFDFSFSTGRYLWAEDGLTFFNGARTGGFGTVTQPYEGYLHVLPRLVAWLASDLPLAVQPLVYIGAWVVALVVMIGTIATRGRAMGMDAATVCGVALLCTFQPTSHEMFFNLTNAQWLLGLALTLQLLTREEWRGPLWQVVALILLCLTGPFCLVILPLVLAIQIGRRPTGRTLVVLGCIVAGTALQLLFLLTTYRTAGKTEHVDPWSVVASMVQLFLFLPNRLREWLPAAGFWLVYGWLLIAAVVKRDSRSLMRTRYVVLLVAAAFAFLAASMITGAFPPRILDHGPNRYTWIPYSLLFFTAATLSTRLPAARLWMAACLAVVCFSKYGPIYRTDFHYASFVKLAQWEAVAIPINPVSISAGWQLDTGTPAISLTETDATVSRTRSGAGAFVDLSRARIACDHASDIAIELEGDHLIAGLVTLSWSRSEAFSQRESMERWYRSGPVRMQYAFPYPAGGVYLRSLQLSDPTVVTVRKATVTCLR